MSISESNLVNHARRELEILGEEPETVEGYLRVIQAFADMGHSGGSAAVAVPVITHLLQFKNLTPLTDDPNEWQVHSPSLAQNKRNSEAFSIDGGKTYYVLSERNGATYPVHTSDHADIEEEPPAEPETPIEPTPAPE